jgi:hypothetical protein
MLFFLSLKLCIQRWSAGQSSAEASTVIPGPASFALRFRRSALRELALFKDAAGGNGQWRSI